MYSRIEKGERKLKMTMFEDIETLLGVKWANGNKFDTKTLHDIAVINLIALNILEMEKILNASHNQ